MNTIWSLLAVLFRLQQYFSVYFVQNRSPQFTLQPQNIYIIGSTHGVTMTCRASGNPAPVITWYKVAQVRTLIKTGGPDQETLQIDNPAESSLGYYECQANNSYGSIMSRAARIYVPVVTLLNAALAPVQARAYEGAILDCPAIFSHSQPNVIWFQNHPDNVLRPENDSRLFISKTGKLYFSEVLREDMGNYQCSVGLQPPLEDDYAQTFGSVTRKTSQAFPFVVLSYPPSVHRPAISDDFPAVFPSVPLRGQTIYLECFAFGSEPLTYNWTKVDGELPHKSTMEDHNRTLVIENVQMKDMATFRCTVTGPGGTDSKDFSLRPAAAPFFTANLEHRSPKPMSTVKFACNAQGLPTPVIKWYKDSVPIAVSDHVTIQASGQELLIVNVTSVDDGMYQCVAENMYGRTVGSAAGLKVREPVPWPFSW